MRCRRDSHTHICAHTHAHAVVTRTLRGVLLHFSPRNISALHLRLKSQLIIELALTRERFCWEPYRAIVSRNYLFIYLFFKNWPIDFDADSSGCRWADRAIRAGPWQIPRCVRLHLALVRIKSVTVSAVGVKVGGEGVSNANQMSSVLFGSCEMSHYYIDSGRKTHRRRSGKTFLFGCAISLIMMLFGGQNHVTSVQRGGSGTTHYVGPDENCFLFPPKFCFSISIHWKSVFCFFR